MWHYAVIGIVIELVQTPVDVTVTDVAALSTTTTILANNSALVAVLGVTVPVSAVRSKLGPKSDPNPAFNVNVISIFIFLI